MRQDLQDFKPTFNLEEQLLMKLCSQDLLEQLEFKARLYNIPRLELLAQLPQFYKVLAKITGAVYAPFFPHHAKSQLKPEEYKHAIATGIVPFENRRGKLCFWHAAKGEQLHIFLNNCAIDSAFAKHIYLCEPEEFQNYLRHKHEAPWLHDAIFALKANMPHFSAGHYKTMAKAALTPVFIIVIFLLTLTSAWALFAGIALSIFFLGWLILRILMCCFFQEKRLQWQSFEDYPLYSILVPLYKEAQIIPQLFKNLQAIDYPSSRLDIKIILEADDHETISALHNLKTSLPFEVIYAPLSAPRTKPKALMLALPFVRGEFCVVFDAEDEPHPLQLREAVQQFKLTKASVLQAPLVIRNSGVNFITSLFAADYASLFDVTLPTLSRFNMPLPLGGTSNHFHTHDLRYIGGWDPFNVTEDADLGLRLAQFGLEAGTLTLGTFEDAPQTFGVWFKQRARWYKGWCQTLYVHFSHPIDLFKNLGLIKTVALFLFLGSNLLSALIHPLALVYMAINPQILGVAMLLSGYLLCALTYIFSIKCGRRDISLKYLGFIPLYWLMLSCAAYRGLWELLIRPYHWHKTPHEITLGCVDEYIYSAHTKSTAKTIL